MEKTRGGRLWKLFLTNLSISACTFGGGFVIVTFMKRKYVNQFHWIDDEEMLDMTALAQSAPGAIAVNAAILIGWKMAGFAGMLVSVLGTILPPMVILGIISVFYAAFAANKWVALALKGMQAGVAAVIFDAAWSLARSLRKQKGISPYLVLIGAFLASQVFHVNVVLIILLCALIGLIRALWEGRRNRR